MATDSESSERWGWGWRRLEDVGNGITCRRIEGETKRHNTSAPVLGPETKHCLLSVFLLGKKRQPLLKIKLTLDSLLCL